MDDGIYVPMSQRALRDLDQLVSITGIDEDRIIDMALTNLLACLRQYENDNFPDDETELPEAFPPVDGVPSVRAPEGEPAGL